MTSWIPTSVGWQLLVGLFVVNCLGEVGVPVPLVLSAVLLFVGYLLANGALAEGASVLMVSVFGSVAGALLLYAVARWVGAAAMERALRRLRVHRLLGGFGRTTTEPGFLTIVQSRLVPGLALPTTVVAGATRSSVAEFVSGVVLSEAIFITPIVAVGFAFGATAGDFESLAHRIPLIIGALAAAVLSLRLAWRVKRAMHEKQTADLP